MLVVYCPNRSLGNECGSDEVWRRLRFADVELMAARLTKTDNQRRGGTSQAITAEQLKVNPETHNKHKYLIQQGLIPPPRVVFVSNTLARSLNQN